MVDGAQPLAEGNDGRLVGKVHGFAADAWLAVVRGGQGFRSYGRRL